LGAHLITALIVDSAHGCGTVSMMARRMVQLPLPPKGRGGWRPGAGRPKSRTSGVPHLRRSSFPKRFPLHVTLRVGGDVGSLRTNRCFRRIQRAFFYGHDRFGMRLVEFSVQANHIHLVVEAEDRRALWRGMQGLEIRLARAINRVLHRTGKVFVDRYHARVLKTPKEVRRAVEYVRHNFKKHQARRGRATHPWYIDPYSSMSGEARWYVDQHWRSALIVAAPDTWLLKRATAPPSKPVHNRSGSSRYVALRHTRSQPTKRLKLHSLAGAQLSSTRT
jgi:putative transposase